MKDEVNHYFNLAIKRLENRLQQADQKHQPGQSATAEVVPKDIVIFLLEILKEQVPNEDIGSSAR